MAAISEVGYKYFRLRTERVPWKASNCAMLSCEYIMNHKESYDTLLHNSVKLRSQLKSMCGILLASDLRIDILDQTVIKYKKDKDIKALLNSRTAYYLNEHSVLYAMQCLGEAKLEAECHSVADSLAYLIELWSFKAHTKNVLLVLGTEACFPKEVLGDRVKFEMLMQCMLDYLINHSAEGEIKFSAKMKSLDAMGSGLILGFEILAKRNENVNVKSMEKIFGHGAAPQGKLSLDQSNCKSLITILKGNVELTEHDEGTMRISFELPFANRDSSRELVSVPRLNIFEAERVNEYTTRWLNKRVQVVEEKPAPSLASVTRSPTIRPVDRLNLKPKHGEDQEQARKGVMERLKRRNAAAEEASGSSKLVSETSPEVDVKTRFTPPMSAVEESKSHARKTAFYMGGSEKEKFEAGTPDMRSGKENEIDKIKRHARHHEGSRGCDTEEDKRPRRSEDEAFGNDQDLEYAFPVITRQNSVGEDIQSDVNRIPAADNPMTTKARESKPNGKETPEKRASHFGTPVENRLPVRGCKQGLYTASYQQGILYSRVRYHVAL